MEQLSAFITILGRPNVGKSSLLNSILGQKVAIVSNKPQTTRTRIMGVYTTGEKQLVFIDTPGFHKPRNILGDNMIKTVKSSMSDVDAAILVVDACPDFRFDPENIPPAELSLIESLKSKKLPCVLAINKIDLNTQKDELLIMIKAYSSLYDFDAVIPLSSKTGDGIDILLNELDKYTKPSVHFFSGDDITDQQDSVMVSEIIREKLLLSLDKEIPHGIAVGLERFFERDLASGDPILDIEAVIYCEKDSHKGIIIGKGGSMLKRIGTLSRKDIEEFFGIKTSLKLWVKVKEDWRNRQGLINSFGLQSE